MEKSKRPSVGVGTLVLNKDKDEILIFWWKEKGAPLGFPGGHLERYETIQECSSRELYEETGLSSEPSWHIILEYINAFNKELHKHVFDIITLLIVTDEEAAQVYNKSLGEHYDFRWYPWSEFLQTLDFPEWQPLFISLYDLFGQEKYRSIEYLKSIQ